MASPVGWKSEFQSQAGSQAACRNMARGDGYWPYWNKLTSCSAACQTFLSSSIFQSLLKFMSIESVILSISSFAAPFSFCLQSFPAPGSFPVSQFFTSGVQCIIAMLSNARNIWNSEVLYYQERSTIATVKIFWFQNLGENWKHRTSNNEMLRRSSFLVFSLPITYFREKQ